MHSSKTGRKQSWEQFAMECTYAANEASLMRCLSDGNFSTLYQDYSYYVHIFLCSSVHTINYYKNPVFFNHSFSSYNCLAREISKSQSWKFWIAVLKTYPFCFFSLVHIKILFLLEDKCKLFSVFRFQQTDSSKTK